MLGSTPRSATGARASRPPREHDRVGQSAEPAGREPVQCGFDSHLGHCGRIRDRRRDDRIESEPSRTVLIRSFDPSALILEWDRSRARAVPCKHGDGVQLPAVPLRRTGPGYGWPGRGANACARKGMRVRIPPPPLADDPVAQRRRHLLDVEEIGGSTPPGITPMTVGERKTNAGTRTSVGSIPLR